MRHPAVRCLSHPNGRHHQPPAAERARPGARVRGRARDRRRARGERPARPARPARRARPARGRGRRPDRLLDRRALDARPREHRALGRDGAARLGDGRRRAQHAAARGARSSCAGASSGARKASPRSSPRRRSSHSSWACHHSTSGHRPAARNRSAFAATAATIASTTGVAASIPYAGAEERDAPRLLGERAAVGAEVQPEEERVAEVVERRRPGAAASKSISATGTPARKTVLQGDRSLWPTTSGRCERRARRRVVVAADQACRRRERVVREPGVELRRHFARQPAENVAAALVRAEVLRRGVEAAFAQVVQQPAHERRVRPARPPNGRADQDDAGRDAAADERLLRRSHVESTGSTSITVRSYSAILPRVKVLSTRRFPGPPSTGSTTSRSCRSRS